MHYRYIVRARCDKLQHAARKAQLAQPWLLHTNYARMAAYGTHTCIWYTRMLREVAWQPQHGATLAAAGKQRTRTSLRTQPAIQIPAVNSTVATVYAIQSTGCDGHTTTVTSCHACTTVIHVVLT
jgi:hypothetical protein